MLFRLQSDIAICVLCIYASKCKAPRHNVGAVRARRNVKLQCDGRVRFSDVIIDVVTTDVLTRLRFASRRTALHEYSLSITIARRHECDPPQCVARRFQILHRRRTMIEISKDSDLARGTYSK